MAGFFRLVGEENRLKIICLLKGGERCVCEITESLGLPQNLVSSHLKALREAGVIDSRQEWKKVYYAISRKMSRKYGTIIINFLKSYDQR